MWMKTGFQSHFHANFHSSVTLLFLFRFSWNFHQNVELRNWEWYTSFWEVFAHIWIEKGPIFGPIYIGPISGLGKSLWLAYKATLLQPMHIYCILSISLYLVWTCPTIFVYFLHLHLICSVPYLKMTIYIKQHIGSDKHLFSIKLWNPSILTLVLGTHRVLLTTYNIMFWLRNLYKNLSFNYTVLSRGLQTFLCAVEVD